MQKLETAIAYMETCICARWFYPMEAWTATRTFLIVVHGWASQDPRIRHFTWRQFREELIPHITPYNRTSEPYDMFESMVGLARLAKESFPLVCLATSL